MADLPTWEELVAGRGCPLCAPREKYTEFIHYVGTLPTSTLYLSKNQGYPGSCSLIYDARHVVGISQLSAHEWSAFAADIHAVEMAVRQALAPDHMNVEILGNSVPHLHVHFVPRYRCEPRWRQPIWTTVRQEMPNVRLKVSEYAALAQRLDKYLGYPGSG